MYKQDEDESELDFINQLIEQGDMVYAVQLMESERESRPFDRRLMMLLSKTYYWFKMPELSCEVIELVSTYCGEDVETENMYTISKAACKYSLSYNRNDLGVIDKDYYLDLAASYRRDDMGKDGRANSREELTLTACITHHPKSAEAHLALGRIKNFDAKSDLDENKERIGHLERALELNPRLYETYYHLGERYFDLYDIEYYFERARELDIRLYGEGYSMNGHQRYYPLNDLCRAKQYLCQYISLCDGDICEGCHPHYLSNAYGILGNIAEAEMDYRIALAYYERSLVIGPARSWVRNDIERIKQKLKLQSPL